MQYMEEVENDLSYTIPAKPQMVGISRKLQKQNDGISLLSVLQGFFLITIQEENYDV